VKNPKHYSKEFTLNMHVTNVPYRRYSRGGNAEYFTPCDVDVETDSGVYVMIDKFYCQSTANDTYHQDRPSAIINVLNNLKKLGITIPVVYAFKEKNRAKVMKNPNMVNVWTWIAAQVRSYFDNKAEQELVANYTAIQNAKANCDGIENFTCLKKMHIAPTSDLATFLDNIKVVFAAEKSDVEMKKQLASRYAKVTDFKATIDIMSEWKKAKAKYPLLFALVRCGEYNGQLASHVKHLENYVEMIDNLPVV
jgi:hypothetical protein